MKLTTTPSTFTLFILALAFAAIAIISMVFAIALGNAPAISFCAFSLGVTMFIAGFQSRSLKTA